MATAFGASLSLTVVLLIHVRLSEGQAAGSGATGADGSVASALPPVATPTIGYPYVAFDPAISEETIRLHLDKHQGGYVTRINTLLTTAPWNGWLRDNKDAVQARLATGMSIPTAVAQLAPRDSVLYNMAAQIYNHALYFHGLRPPQADNAVDYPAADHPLSAVVASTFGGYDALVGKLKESALGHFGSGWAWLVANASTANGKTTLQVVGTHDAGWPLVTTPDYAVWPLLVCDVWEHAYYVDHRNDRAKYFAAWTTVVDWAKVARRFEQQGRVERPVDAASETGTRTYPLF